jgi:hypothetical protein
LIVSYSNTIAGLNFEQVLCRSSFFQGKPLVSDMTFSKKIKGSLSVILSPVLPIFKPFDLNLITLFQIQEPLGMIPNLNPISYTHYTLLNI